VAYQKSADDCRLSQSLRNALASAGIRSKLAVALRDRGHDVGLLCLDSSREEVWSADACETVDRLAREVIGPVLGASLELSGQGGFLASTAAGTTTHLSAFSLTPAELRVAELVLAGLSYKEIARKLDRSCSTIDHQLRSMRDKFGVNSTAKLVHALSSQLASPFAGARLS
jgi:DNA-binding CsgD family transcriptional regulator